MADEVISKTNNMDSDSDEDLKMSRRDWNKLAENATKRGYREGIIDGRDAVFQQSFDDGFAEGMKIGFTLGEFQGILTAVQSDKIETSNNIKDTSKTLSTNQLLQKIPRGQCQICENKDYLEKPVPEVINLQNIKSKEVLLKLNDDYRDIKETFDLEIKTEV